MTQVTENSINNLRTKIESIRFGMMTTQNHDKSLSSRPMTQQQLDEDGILWFFLSDESQLARDITAQPKINVAFANPSDNVFVSVTGNAEIIKSRRKAESLWGPSVAPWFPQGLDDPHLALVKFTIDSAEYWDSHTDKMLHLFSIAKAAIVGERPKQVGEHEKLEF